MTGDLATSIPTSTTFDLPGYTVERTLGLSWGLIVRSVGLTKGLTGGLREPPRVHRRQGSLSLAVRLGSSL
jgi:uncharacterized protein YbjQ (UPF0145 family)